jgi:hypothetical protein
MLLMLAFLNIALASTGPLLEKTDFKSFSWVLENDNKVPVNPADVLPPEANAYGRDLHWVADPKNRANILRLKASGKKFICYFTAGTIPSEKFLTDPHGVPQPTIYDRHFFKDAKTRTPYSEACSKPTPWGDYFVNWHGIKNREAAIQAITGMMDDPASELCDGFEFDNTDLYNQGDDKPCATKSDVVQIMSTVCKHAHKIKKAGILKNSGLVARELSKVCDGAIVESCLPNSQNPDFECNYFQPFAKLKKPIYIQEYESLDVAGINSGYGQKFSRPCQSVDDSQCTRDFIVDCRGLKDIGISDFAVAPSQRLNGRNLHGYCSTQTTYVENR